MKIWFLAVALLIAPLAVSADGERLKPFRAKSVEASDGITVLILGPESVQLGTLVKLDASKTTGDTFTWKLAGGSDDLYEVSDDGKKVYFASPAPGKFSFLLAVAKSNGDKPPSLVIAEHTLVIQGPAPNPNPNPNPDPVVPQPTDPLDSGKFGLARVVRDLVKGAIPADKRAASAGFSANYALVASGVKNKTIGGWNVANLKLRDANRATAGTDLTLWANGVIIPLADKLKSMEAAKMFSSTNTDDLAQVFSEISLGFAAAVGS